MAGPPFNPRLCEFLDGLSMYQEEFADCGRVEVNTRARTGDTPLIVAVIRREVEVTGDLLKAGAEPNIQGEDGFTPLHWAVQGDGELVRLLLSFGASSDMVNDFGDTPVDIARRHKDAVIIMLLNEQRS